MDRMSADKLQQCMKQAQKLSRLCTCHTVKPHGRQHDALANIVAIYAIRCTEYESKEDLQLLTGADMATCESAALCTWRSDS